MSERKFYCEACGSLIEVWGDGKPITGCPHHFPEKRSHIKKERVVLSINATVQWEPSVGWVAELWGITGEGKTMRDATAILQQKLIEAGY